METWGRWSFFRSWRSPGNFPLTAGTEVPSHGSVAGYFSAEITLSHRLLFAHGCIVLRHKWKHLLFPCVLTEQEDTADANHSPSSSNQGAKLEVYARGIALLAAKGKQDQQIAGLLLIVPRTGARVFCATVRLLWLASTRVPTSFPQSDTPRECTRGKEDSVAIPTAAAAGAWQSRQLRRIRVRPPPGSPLHT